MAQKGLETSFVYGPVFLQGIYILVDQCLPECVREIGFGLPEEGGHVVVDRSPSPALEVNEPRPVFSQHDVAALEVPVHEGGCVLLQQDVGHGLEVIFQAVFLKIHARGFQEAILEIIEVPKHRAAVEGGLRIATVEIQSFSSPVLQGRQQADCFAEEASFSRVEVLFARAFGQHVEQGCIAQVFLQIT